MPRFDLHLEHHAVDISFLDRYTYICEREGLSLFRPIIAKLSKYCLEVNLDMISKNDLIALLYALVSDSTLTSIRFESRLLKDNPYLTSDLRKLHLHSQGRRLPAYVEPEVMSSLCNALHRHISRNELNLKVLRLNGLPIGDEELAEVSSALQVSKSLHLLSLEGIPLSGKHVDVLFPVIPLVQTLTILNLAQCCLGRAEVLQISRYLQNDRKLQRLILNGNPVGDTGVEYLVKVLRNHTTFRALDLQNCGISSVGCLNLQDLLANNLTIEVCDIRRNTAVSRSSALTIAKVLLENNKYRQNGTTYRPLALDMSPAIDASKIAMEESGLCGIRHDLPPRYVPSVKLPPKDLQLKVQNDNSGKELIAYDGPAKNRKGIFISNHLLSKFETSLIKFQVLLDYLETEHLDTALGFLSGEKSNSGLKASIQQLCDGNAQIRQVTTFKPSSVQSPNDQAAPQVNDSNDALLAALSLTGRAPQPHKHNGLSLKENKTSRRKMYNSSFIDTTPVSSGNGLVYVQDAVSSSFGCPPSGSITLTKSESTLKKSLLKAQKEQQDENDVEEKENDRTITSNHEFNTNKYAINFADVGGITKESSYMEVAHELFDDPKHVLESTRTSLTSSQNSSSKTDSPVSTKTKTNTNVDELQERLKNIQSRYSVTPDPFRALSNLINDSSQDGKRKIRADDLDISESLAIGTRFKGSLELENISLESSFSGDFSGSDLEKF